MTRIFVKSPSECTVDEIKNFCDLVSTEAQVNLNMLSDNVLRAEKLCFSYVSSELVAVSAIKNARLSYREKVCLKSRSDVDLKEVPHELGYVVVAPHFRGKGFSTLMANELAKAIEGCIFATSTTDNIPMHRTLEKLRFVKRGVPYNSTENPMKNLALFIRDPIINTK